VDSVTVKDERGRSIEVRRIKTLDRMKLLELIGPDNSMNSHYLSFATLEYSVASIDGMPVASVRSKLALEAVVQQLDDDGFAAVADAFAKNFLPPAITEDEAKAAVKNG
jgi:hypothetical protein